MNTLTVKIDPNGSIVKTEGPTEIEATGTFTKLKTTLCAGKWALKETQIYNHGKERWFIKVVRLHRG